MYEAGLEIRLLTAADANQFWQLRLNGIEDEPAAFRKSAAEHRTQGAGLTRERLSATTDDFVVGAFKDGDLVGSIGFHRAQGEKVQHRGLVWGVYLSPSARQRGIARQMFGYLLARVRAMDGIEQLYLHVAEGQDAARRLYEAVGFHYCGTEPRALKIGKHYVAEHLMILQL